MRSQWIPGKKQLYIYGTIAGLMVLTLLSYSKYFGATAPGRIWDAGYVQEFHNWHALLNITVPNKFRTILDSNIPYREMQPFPHFVADEIFPDAILKQITVEFTDKPRAFIGNTDCIEGGKCSRDGNQTGKSELSHAESYGPATAALFAFLKSPTSIHFLETLTGIKDLIIDDLHMGSGLHQSLPGGLLGIHADFNKHKITKLHRRVNLFVFFNPDWEESYGGHLELWPKNLSSCQQRILPVLGRFVVFSSTDFSYHGHPHPLTCPPHRSRRSLALYFYTRTRPAEDCINHNCDGKRRTTNFVQPSCHCGTKHCGEELAGISHSVRAIP